MAIGTIAAVSYALFRDLIVTPRRRPKLDLRFDRAGNDQIVVGTAGGFEAAWVRLRVTNERRRDTADDVVVMVTELRRLTSSDETTAEVRPIGLPLPWSGSNPRFTVASVHPASERHDETDIARNWSDAVLLQLDLAPKPDGGQDMLDPGAYEISVEIRARNADTICYVVPVSWDGQWSGKAAMWDHLRVESPQRVRS